MTSSYKNGIKYLCAKEEIIRGHQLPLYILTFEGLIILYGYLDL